MMVNYLVKLGVFVFVAVLVMTLNSNNFLCTA